MYQTFFTGKLFLKTRMYIYITQKLIISKIIKAVHFSLCVEPKIIARKTILPLPPSVFMILV